MSARSTRSARSTGSEHSSRSARSNRRLALGVAGALSIGTALAGAAVPASAESRPPVGRHIPATELRAAEGCPVPATADPRVLVTMKRVLDRHHVSRKVRVASYQAAWVESHANDLNCGHATSIGVFQQRPDYGWVNAGKPRLATRDFLRGNPSDSTPGAITVARNHPAWSPGQVAQAVQRSAYPDRYDAARAKARTLIERANRLDTDWDPQG